MSECDIGVTAGTDCSACAYENHILHLQEQLRIRERRAELLVADKYRLENSYNALLEDVRGACGCTDGDDIRAHLEEYL